ncbi:MAG: hypothetical protein RBU37_06970 [Myxococcota bacterium]|jgi:hypothetical protein|nr:hypothetical protein [Myxococcota bacterium]
MKARRDIALVWLMFVLTPAAGCDVSLFHDAISTTVEIPATDVASMVATTKRFRFERDIAAASSAVMYQAWVSVDSPSSFDLSFLSSVDIYAVIPDSSERTLLVRGVSFAPGERFRHLDIVFDEDLRHLVVDQRVTLEWELMPNQLFSGWDGVEQADLRFGIVLEIETDS